jgi:uncharacterized protein
MALQVLSKRSGLLTETRVPYLSDEERVQVAELLARLEEECETDVHRVILYGSKARGDAVQWSDIDLLIVTVNGSERVKNICDRFHHDNAFLVGLTFSHEGWEYYKRLKPPFYVNVRREGIELWDDLARQTEESHVSLDFPEGELRPLDYETIEVIRMYVRESRDRWQEAMLVRDNLSKRRALSDAYYAAFNLATAVLYSVNVVRNKHSGVESAISQFLVKSNLIEEEFKTSYTALHKGRIWSDYERVKREHLDDITEEQAGELLQDAEKLIARFENFLRERGAMID